MKTNLFNALNSAGKIVCDGFKVDHFAYDTPGVVRLETTADVTVYLPDQIVDIDADGQCDCERLSSDESSDMVSLEFRVSIPLRQMDLMKIEPVKTAQVTSLKAISSSGGLKSISDDDLCATCSSCAYKPGENSGCSEKWPGQEDEDGTVKQCKKFKLKRSAVCTRRVPSILSPTGEPIEVGESIDYLRLAFRNGENHLVLANGQDVPHVFFDMAL